MRRHRLEALWLSLGGVGLGACEAGQTGWQAGPVGAIEEPAALREGVDLMGDTLAEGDGFSVPAPEPVAAEDGPRVLYLWYADGGKPPVTTSYCPGTPTKFVCGGWGGGGDDCAKKIQTYLDRWYKDFNLVFTFQKPTSGRYYSEVVTSDGSWCSQSAGGTLGIALLAGGCADQNGGVAYTFFCSDGQVCAHTIAQEHAHLVGLGHTSSMRDLMYPGAPCATCDGFEDVANSSIWSGAMMCWSTQNSYAKMKERLGAWPGGSKPDPWGSSSCTDAAAPTIKISEPADGASVASDFSVTADASDDCGVEKVHIDVAPAGLGADADAAPYHWSLTDLAGKQTITVTATDGAGKTASARITVTAGKAGGAGGGGSAGRGGQSGGGGQGGSGSPHGATMTGVCGVGGESGRAAGWPVLLALGALIARRRRRQPNDS